MTRAPDVGPLRRCVLAACVLDGVDAVPHRDGVELCGDRRRVVPWAQIARVAGADPSTPGARRRVATLLHLSATVQQSGADAAARLVSAARLLALPPGHCDHLGPDWVVERLPGGCLEMGFGVIGMLADPDGVVPLPPAVRESCSLDVTELWLEVRHYADRMGALAVTRLSRERHPHASARRRVLRPVGGCDVLALLSSRALRRHLAGIDGTGLCAVSVPMRARGWYDISRIDPAFTGTAWSLTGEAERGLRTPVLVTADAVTAPAPGGNPASVALERDGPGGPARPGPVIPPRRPL